jgi:hypothetical protein
VKINLMIATLIILVLVASVPALAIHETPPGANPECFKHDGSTTSPKDARKMKKQIKSKKGGLSKSDKQRIEGLNNRIDEWNECKQWFIDHPEHVPPTSTLVAETAPEPEHEHEHEGQPETNPNPNPEPKVDIDEHGHKPPEGQGELDGPGNSEPKPNPEEINHAEVQKEGPGLDGHGNLNPNPNPDENDAVVHSADQ